MRPISLVVVLLSALLTSWTSGHASADGISREARKRLKQQKKTHKALLKKARSFRNYRMPGDQVQASVAKLTSQLTWHKSIETALAAAKEQDRPLLWIHALGELTGYV